MTRLILLAALALSTWANAYTELPPLSAIHCPAEDVGGWYYYPEGGRSYSGRWEWIRLTPESFREQCGDADGSDPNTLACTWIINKRSFDAYAVTYSRRHLNEMPNWYVEHEGCHAKGWRHGDWIDPRLTSSLFRGPR